MNKAIQELKTRAGWKYILVGFLLLAAAFGFIVSKSHDRTTSSDSKESVVQQYESVVKIQKQTLIEQKSISSKISREQYKVLTGDNLWTIASNNLPKNVEINNYIEVLKAINQKSDIHPGTVIELPSTEDLLNVTLPDVELKFNVFDSEVVEHIKKYEGTSDSQSKNKRHLLGGKVAPSFKNGKFYPYRDSTGNFTIGYGHYLGKGESTAVKYKNGITAKQAQNILMQDMLRTRDDFILLLQRKGATDLTVEQQRILFEMSYNMGCDKLATFDRMWSSVKHSNHTKFKREIKNSKWYTQVGERATILLSSL